MFSVYSLVNIPPCLSCHRDHLICMELWPSDAHRLAYTTSLLLFQYCLPLLLVLLCYLRIFLRLKRRRSRSFARSSFSQEPRSLASHAVDIHRVRACVCVCVLLPRYISVSQLCLRFSMIFHSGL